MSLINDALRRAKQAQRAKPATETTPGLRPIEPGVPPAKSGSGILVPVALGAVGLLTLFLLWQFAGHRSSTNATEETSSLSVAARPLTTSEPTVAASEHSSKGSASISGNESGGENVAMVPQTAPGNSANLAAGSSTNVVAVASETTETNRPPATEAALSPLKLQSIVFNPKRPSAMINGKVVFVGDRVRDLRVMVIRPAEVILIGSGRTNVMSLEP